MTEKLEKIIVGDDRIDFARANFPFIPNAQVDFFEFPLDVINGAKTGQYSTVVTDLEYTSGGREGFEVLEAIRDVNARKILWTGAAHLEEVQNKARELGVELLDKNQIGSLVGQIVNKAPLKKDGGILVYSQNSKENYHNAMVKVFALAYDESKLKVGSDLKKELESGKYGLVIDTSTMMGSGKNPHGTVAHDMKYLKLAEVPRVVCVYDVCTLVSDVLTNAREYFAKQKNSRSKK